MNTVLEPRDIRPQQWQVAVDFARETCARLFCDGRSPADAVRSYGLVPSMPVTWAHAVNVIAEVHCAPRVRQVA